MPSPALSQSLLLAAFVALGFLCAKLGVLRQEHSRGLSRFALNVSLPALIFASMIKPYDPTEFPRILWVLGLSFGVYAAGLILALVLGRVLYDSSAPKRRGIYQFSLIFSNVGFMGYPIMAAIFGKESIFLTAIYNISFQVLAFSLGPTLISSAAGLGRPGRAGGTWRRVLKTLFNVNVLAALLGLGFFLLRLSPPALVMQGLNSLGEVTSPLSMVFIGTVLARTVNLRLLADFRLWVVVAFRLLGAPILLFFTLGPLARAFGFPLEIPVMIAAMPVAANAAMLAEEYGGEVDGAALIVMVSTLASIFSIPLLAHWLFAR